MKKKYIVRLSDEERDECAQVIKKQKGSASKVRRAQMLLKADADGPGWTDAKIAEAFNCRTRTVEKLRERLVVDGFELTLQGKNGRRRPPRPNLMGRGKPN
ncbi:MAG: helix-turn-helix domain-containing protein [Anaerolineales bacterium]|nr:helix-turn-helix domain-containing protein [Anaerolineales bacterium]